MRRGIAAALLVSTALVLATASTALGATRFAAPTDQGTGDCSSATDACDLQQAVEDAAVMDADEVIVAGNLGTLALGPATLDVNDAINLHGATGQPRPNITASNGSLVVSVNDDATVSDLQFHQVGLGQALQTVAESPHNASFLNPTLERLFVRSAVAGDSATCSFSGTALMRDSVCWNSGLGNGTRLSVAGTGTQVFTLTLRNVTTVVTGEGTSTTGLRASGFDLTLTIDAKNVIAMGYDGNAGAADVEAEHMGPGSSTVTLENSNYSTESDVFGNFVTNPGTGTNQTAPPMFVDAFSGDFHQIAGSPTIDAGSLAASMLGPLDFELDMRSLDGNCDGTATPDIGADEFTVTCPAPPTPTTPTTTAAGPTGQRAAALKKCKKKRGQARRKCKRKANQLPV